MNMQSLITPFSLFTDDEPFSMDPARWALSELKKQSLGGASDIASDSRILSPLDLVECPDSFCLSLDLPGVDKKDVTMRVKDGLLIISGERKDVHKAHKEAADIEKTWHIIERSFGRFERRIRLPKSADQKTIDASMENGVLHVQIGKLKEAEKVDAGKVVVIR